MSKNTNLSFLTDYITADITNGRIGINNASPTVAFDVVGATKITGVLTLTSTISNGTYTYTLPSATGTLALTSALSGYLPLSGGTLTGALSGTSATFSSRIVVGNSMFLGEIVSSYSLIETTSGNGIWLRPAGGSDPTGLKIATTGAATFSSSVTVGTNLASGTALVISNTTNARQFQFGYSTGAGYNYFQVYDGTSFQSLVLNNALTLASTGAATFSSSVVATTFGVSGTTGAVFTSGAATTSAVYGYINNTSGRFYFGSESSTGGTITTGSTAYYGQIAGQGLQFSANTGNNVHMTILPSGNVGIGTTSPSSLLNTYSATTATQIIVTGADTTNQRLEVTDGTVTNRFGIQGRTNGDVGTIGTQTNHSLVFNTNNTERMRLLSAGDLVVGGTTSPLAESGRGGITINGSSNSILTYTVGGTLTGYIYHSGNGGVMDLHNSKNNAVTYVTSYTNGVYLATNATSWTANSDIRLKNIISPIDSAVDKLTTLNPVIFSWKSDDTNKENIGLIAQDVKEVFPQVIDTNEDGFLGVRYVELIPVLVKAIQELSAKVTLLENK